LNLTHHRRINILFLKTKVIFELICSLIEKLPKDLPIFQQGQQPAGRPARQEHTGLIIIEE